jgi:hypothetical protein
MAALLRITDFGTQVHRNALFATTAATRRDSEALASARGILVAVLMSVLLFWLPIVVALRHL